MLKNTPGRFLTVNATRKPTTAPTTPTTAPATTRNPVSTPTPTNIAASPAVTVATAAREGDLIVFILRYP